MSNNNIHTLQIGSLIEDKWIILEFLGKGGMGEVYRAHQLNLKRDVAIKIISREWLDSVEENKEEREIGLQRFRNEVLSMAQVRHPNLLQIYDYGSFSSNKGQKDLGFEYIVMEYIPGGTLRSTMSEDGFYPEEGLVKDWVVRYFLPVLDGVQALHKAGIIHRDLKPGNILMDGHTPRITDFGLARSSRIRPVTLSMDIKGTPAYMSPEHFMDLKRADHRSDIYSLGKILFEAIDGKIGPEVIPLKSASLRRAGSPFFEKFDRIILTATAEDRDQRYDSGEELRSAILDALKIIKGPADRPGITAGQEGVESPSRPKWIAGGIALAVILLLAMTLWYLFGGPGKSDFKINGTAPAQSDITSANSSLSSLPAEGAATPLPSEITGNDGAKLHLIPGGQISLPNETDKEPGKLIKINPFYMDETEVTNHQYAEFLNEIISKVQVEEDVVKADGVLWLLLGEAAKGYEPIILKNGKFMVKDPIYHSHPVVRVTAFGAAAYAEYYGRRLPTAAEWLYAERTGKNPGLESSPAPSQGPLNSHEAMMRSMEQKPSVGNQGPSEGPVSVTQSEPNQFAIRGLDGNVNEWGIFAPSGASRVSKETQYGVLPETVERRPWEAFEDVGFRTVLPVLKQK